MKHVKSSIHDIDVIIQRTFETITSLQKLKAAMTAFDSRDTSIFDKSEVEMAMFNVAIGVQSARRRINQQARNISKLTKEVRQCTSEVDRMMDLNDAVWYLDIEGIQYVRTMVENDHCVSLSCVLSDPESYMDVDVNDFLDEVEQLIADNHPKLHSKLPSGNLQMAPLHFQEDNLIVLLSGDL